MPPSTSQAELAAGFTRTQGWVATVPPHIWTRTGCLAIGCAALAVAPYAGLHHIHEPHPLIATLLAATAGWLFRVEHSTKPTKEKKAAYGELVVLDAHTRGIPPPPVPPGPLDFFLGHGAFKTFRNAIGVEILMIELIEVNE
jgi:hypothetical protein